MASIVRTIREKCRRCYTCVRSCPAKAIKVEGGQAAVIEERCLSCGNCVRVCAMNAKAIEKSIPDVASILSGSRPAIACLAPSFPAAFPEVEPGQVLTGLRQVGFAQVMEVAFGAELVALAYRELLDRESATPLITTACPAIVSYVEKYLPELIPCLAPIVSPMVALGRFIRQKYCAEAVVVFIGPCVGKKAEVQDEGVSAAVDAVRTFDELRDLFTQFGVELSDLPSSDFDGPRAYVGGIFPVSGGLLRVADMESDILENDLLVSEGMDRALEVLRQAAGGNLTARFLDLLFCEGCIGGPVMGNHLSLVARKEIIARYVRRRMAAENGDKHREVLLEAGEGLDLSRGFRDRSIPLGEPTESEMREILARMGKHGPDDELNCGACGYANCRDKAVAVHQGLAEAQMCLPYLIEELETTVQQLAQSKIDIEHAQTQLIRSERLASMGQLAASIAHELNNPLGTVLIYAHMLARDLSNADSRREDVTMIAVEADRCRKIVRGLLDFARKRTRRAEPVRLRQLLESVVSVVEKHEDFQNIAIHLDVDPGVPDVDGDPDQLTQAFVNLASNAAEAMPDGGSITISARAAGPGRVEVAVRDEGIGIPEEHVGQLFAPFFTTKRGGKGTGLGLSIVHGIVKMHDGDTRVDSEPGKGSTFTITLNSWREGEGEPEAQTAQALGRHEHSEDDTDR